MKIKLLLSAALYLCFLLTPSLTIAYDNLGNIFGIDTDSNPAYDLYNPFCDTNCGQCTAFAWGRARDRLGFSTTFTINSLRHACRWWLDSCVTNAGVSYEPEPRENSFVVWADATDACCRTYSCTEPTGHVAYVEKVEGDYIYINEANISNHEDTDYGGGFDGFTKRFTIAEISNRSGAGGD